MAADTRVCPLCGYPDVSDQRCPACGVDLSSPDVARYAQLTTEVEALREEWSRVRDAYMARDDERRMLLTAIRERAVRDLPPRPSRALPPPRLPAATGTARAAERPRQRAEWSADRVRDVLLWTGGLLLVLAVVSFVAVLWTRDDSGKPFWTAGRVALLLFGLMIVTSAVALRLRNRLPATAEVVGVLTMALAATDWYAVRRAGFGASVDPKLWWSIGAALGTVLALVAGRLGLRSPRIVAPLLGQLSLVFAFALLDKAFAFALAYGIGSALSVLVAGRLARLGRFRGSVRTLVIGAAWFEFVALLAAIGALLEREQNSTLERAVAVLAVGLAPVVTRWSFAGALERRPRLGHALLAASAMTVQGAVVVAVDPGSTGAFWAAAAVVGGVSCVLAIVVFAPIRIGTAAAGAIAFGLAAAVASVTIATAMLAPLSWLGQPWELDVADTAVDHLVAGETTSTSSIGRWAVVAFVVGPLVAVVLSTARALAAGVVTARMRQWLRPIALLWSATAIPGLVVQYDGVPIGAAWASALVVALALVAIGAWCDRARPALAVPMLAASALPYASMLGWGMTNRVLTVSGFALTACAVSWAAWRASRVAVRSVLACTTLSSALAALCSAVLAIGGEHEAAGFALVASAAAVLVVLAARGGRTLVGFVLEGTAVGGIVIGAAMTASSWTWLASSLTLAAVGFGIAATRDDRRFYVWGVLACGPSAVLTWFAAAGVGAHVEGFVLVVMSGIALVAAAWRRGTAAAAIVESLAMLGLAGGALVAADDSSPAWLAGSLTVALVALSVATVLPSSWSGYPYVVAAVAGGVASAWFATADVHTPEAYTVTWAAVAIVEGWMLRGVVPDTSSWIAYGPGIVIALAPTTRLAIENDDLARTLAALAGGLAAVLIGAARKLQAPSLIGAVTLGAIGIDAIAPAAADLPRWAPLALVGLMLVWLGATAERRLAQVRHLRDVLGQFD